MNGHFWLAVYLRLGRIRWYVLLRSYAEVAGDCGATHRAAVQFAWNWAKPNKHKFVLKYMLTTHRSKPRRCRCVGRVTAPAKEESSGKPRTAARCRDSPAAPNPCTTTVQCCPHMQRAPPGTAIRRSARNLHHPTTMDLRWLGTVAGKCKGFLLDALEFWFNAFKL